jgi:hypothetical protein
LASHKPDKKTYDDEQDRIKSEIDALQVKLVSYPIAELFLADTECQSAVRDKISLATKPNSSNDRRSILRGELDGIRSQQFNNKTSRSKVLEQMEGLQDNIQKKVRAYQLLLA